MGGVFVTDCRLGQGSFGRPKDKAYLIWAVANDEAYVQYFNSFFRFNPYLFFL